MRIMKQPSIPLPRFVLAAATRLALVAISALPALPALPAIIALPAIVAAVPAAAAIPRPEKAKLALQADRTAYAAGTAVRISALVAIETGWHVNSHTPTFDYLIPTVLELELPAGWPQPEVEYPAAQKKSFAFADVPLSVYDGDVVIQALVKIPAGAKAGAVPIRARLNYQACDHSQCLPPVVSRSQLTLTVRAAGQGQGGPGSDRSPGSSASDTGGGKPAGIQGGGGPAAPAAATLPGHVPAGHLPYSQGAVAPSGGASPGGISSGATGPGGTPAGALASGGSSSGGTPAAATASVAAPSGPAKPAPASRRAPSPGGLAAMLLLAVAGGLVLNAMPCVLPVVSLKVFGLVQSASHGRREVVRGALATAAGILVSFWALAALAVAAAAAGAAVGWGIQFQRPGFVAFLAVVVILFCLNLWGLFEIPLPMALARLGGAGAREGLAGHFVSGLFATLMATPCSAPFLGTAIGFALAQPAPIVFAIFTAVGAGLALPYLVLGAAPGAARLLPRPGAWMETLRGIMGFLLGASAVWLLYVLAAQVSPERLAMFEVGLLLVALFTWLRHRAPYGRSAARAGAGAALAAVAVAAVALAATGAGGAGAAGTRSAAAPGQRQPSGLIAWVAFDRARAESLAAGGQLVFVDVTADWCFTCKVNERLILDTPEVAAAFAVHRVLPMRADWTSRNDEITRFLADHGRYGIPFYLLYSPGRDPYVFSELPSKSGILAALDAAAAAAGTQAHKL
jgi:suppressor for copper-sensitivity B